MKNLKLTIALAALIGFVGSAQAVQITGGISLAGDYTLNDTMTAATAFTSFSDIQVTSVSGSYATPGLIVLNSPGSVVMMPFVFNPFGGPVTPLWNTTDLKARFDLTAITFNQLITPNQRSLEGYGTLYLQGFDATPGFWTFTANTAGSTFSFSSSNAALVPDGGTTAMLLGTGLAGLAFLRRRLS